MLLNYPALAQALAISNLQEHLRGSTCRKPTHFSHGMKVTTQPHFYCLVCG